MTTTKAVTHRVRQARSVALRAQLALMLTQALLWVSLIGAVTALAVWAWRRFTAAELKPPIQPVPAPAEPSQTVTSDTTTEGLSRPR